MEVQAEENIKRNDEDDSETMRRRKTLENVVIKCCKKPQQLEIAEVVNCLNCTGIRFPSLELGQVLVSYLCFENNQPSFWKFLHLSVSSRLVSPLHVLSLLSSRVIPNRRSQPEAYRLYLQLLSEFLISLDSFGDDASKFKIIKDVDDLLHLSKTYGVCVQDVGHLLVLVLFTIVIGLIDSSLSDWGLVMKSPDALSGMFRSVEYQEMNIDSRAKNGLASDEHRECLRKTNSFMAMEVLARVTESKKSIILLRLVHFNMPQIFNGLLQRLQFIEVNRSTSPSMKPAAHHLGRFFTNIERVRHSGYELNKHHLMQVLVETGQRKPVSYYGSDPGLFGCWVSFDIYMESAMDGRHLPTRSAVAVLAETVKTLKVFNSADWHETFLALWLSALRFVQRERNPLEGPVPHLESRLSILLAIVPLAIANILEEDVTAHPSSLRKDSISTENGPQANTNCKSSRKHGLVGSLKGLGNFTALLCPPASVISAANAAAAKAVDFVCNSSSAKTDLGGGSHNVTLTNAGGNMWHLIVEACIARNLIDKSAYSWPGYLSASVNPPVDLPPLPKSPWPTFMEGAPLDSSLVNLLLASPATRLPEVEKLYHIALNGSKEEMPAAAKILCGASLSRGWNIQEHVVHYVVKLLSPPIPSSHTGQRSHLIDYMPMLNAILFGVSSVETVHILSLHGMIPDVAAALMPLCEVFGSLMPTVSNNLSMGDKTSSYSVFSCAFLFLLRLWKFYRPPLDQYLKGGGALGGELTLEYLSMLRNNSISSCNSSLHYISDSHLASAKPVYIDSYPKLRAWYCQNKSCIASPLSGVSTINPIHQVANKILNMIYWKITKGGTSSGNSSTASTSSLCGSPPTTGDDPQQRPMIPAWEVLEATPFVLEAVLAACAHGRLSSRDLTTGLRDLIDFLPASLGAIISYFSAEVTRGIWKQVPMNGTDWPSPLPILSSIESEIREVLASAGVDSPSCSSGSSPIMLPLPMAALVSLTITFKLDKGLEYIHAVAGPAMENCASGLPLPIIPIIGSLWAQKVRRWHHFIIASSARCVFIQEKEAVAQLLRSCFSSYLGALNMSTSLLTNQRSINGLLGSIIAVPGVSPSLAPGFLYLRSCRTIQDVQYLNNLLVKLVAEYARESTMKLANTDHLRVKSSQNSLAHATARAREVAILGASLLCVSGGMNLVKKLYQETIPTWMLSFRKEKPGQLSAVSHVLEGYAIAYMLILAGSFVWGIGPNPPSWASSKRSRFVGVHMDFLARVLEGNLSLACHPATWKAYVSCLLSLTVKFSPEWIQEVKLETLRKLACGLKRWNECELALSLLERGGIAAIGSVAEMIERIN